MKTIFLTVYDGDTEKVILQSQVFTQLKGKGHRIVLLVRGVDRLEYYRHTYADTEVFIEELPLAMTRAEMFWYHLGWNTLPTHSASLRRMQKYRQHNNLVRYVLEKLLGLLGQFRLWREILRGVYTFMPDNYCAEYFKTYQPDLVFTPNMFSAEDMRMLRQAKRHGVKTIATAKSWDVLTTKAFTRVRAAKLLVFNEPNRLEAIELGDYVPGDVIVTGFPQFDVYARRDWVEERNQFCERLRLDPVRKIISFAVPGDWKTPYTKDILRFLDDAIISGRFSVPVQIIARLHPKYPDSSEAETYTYVVHDRPGTHFTIERETTIDMGIPSSYQWTFTSSDVTHLANTLFHSELVINTESTLTLDAAALGKPAILIGYDGLHMVPYLDSIARVYEREHYQQVLRTEAVPMVRSNEELFSMIETFLQDPDHLRRQREMLVHTLLYKVDGCSGERMASAILAQLT